MNKVFTVSTKYDDTIGHWWVCGSCDADVFIPHYDDKRECKQYKYCPFCGEIILSFKDEV